MQHMRQDAHKQLKIQGRKGPQKADLRRFLNCTTVVASVELSIVDALLSKRRPEVHKSRVSLSYNQVHIYALTM